MGLKILHSADWHLDSPFAGFPEAQRILLRNEQRKIPGKIADLCRREDCDMMLLAGDLFDGEPTRESIRVLKKALADCGVPVLNMHAPWEIISKADLYEAVKGYRAFLNMKVR